MNDFQSLGISSNLIKGLDELGIRQPTEVQEKAIPFLLKDGSDFVCRAQTGTGKTAAFGIPLLERINPHSDKVQGLILTPTRELAKQIAKHLFRYTKYTEKIFAEAVYGGDPIERQIAALSRRTHIVVATPGRLVDLIKAKAVDLSAVKYVILDEADEMLSMGFRDELNEIIGKTSNRQSIWLFSATLPEGIQKIITRYMKHDCKMLHIDKNNMVNRGITHQYVTCHIQDKLDRILTFLDQQEEPRGLIFCRSKAGAVKLADDLDASGYDAGALQGDLSQKDRDKVMRAFNKRRIQILVSTDVAARGIDIESLPFVIHHQLPENTEYYIHRSGRTARAGKTGISFALIAGKDQKRLSQLESELRIKFDRIA